MQKDCEEMAEFVVDRPYRLACHPFSAIAILIIGFGIFLLIIRFHPKEIMVLFHRQNKKLPVES